MYTSGDFSDELDRRRKQLLETKDKNNNDYETSKDIPG